MSSQDKGKGRAKAPAENVPEYATAGEAGSSKSPLGTNSTEYAGIEGEASNAAAAGAPGASPLIELAREELDTVFQSPYGSYVPEASSPAASGGYQPLQGNTSGYDEGTARASGYLHGGVATRARALPGVSCANINIYIPGAFQKSFGQPFGASGPLDTGFLAPPQYPANPPYGDPASYSYSSNNQGTFIPMGQTGSEFYGAALFGGSGLSDQSDNESFTSMPAVHSSSGRKALPKFPGRLFSSSTKLTAHLAKPQWKTTTGNWGVPSIPVDGQACLTKVYNALVNVDDVWDKETHRKEHDMFLVGGDWSGPKDLQATAAWIIQAITNVHEKGLSGRPGQQLRLPGVLMQYDIFDQDFTFQQRLHWTCFLMEHYKFHAHRFMMLTAVDAHVARIFSVLAMETSFLDWWLSKTDAEQTMHLTNLPYIDVTSGGVYLQHPSPADFARFKTQVAPQQTQAQAGNIPGATAPPPRATGKRPVVKAPESEAGPSSKCRGPGPSPGGAAQQGHRGPDSQADFSQDVHN